MATPLTAAIIRSLIADATATIAGWMSSADKSKLDGIAAGATANSSNSTLLNRANHTGTQSWSTITGAPAITSLVATLANVPGNVVLRNGGSGAIEVGGCRSHGGYYYFQPSGSQFIRFAASDSGFVFSHAATGPAFTPTSDLVLKDNVEAVTDDAAALVQVLSAGQIEYDRTQDGVHALGFAAQALRDINPLWVVGGEPLDPDGPPEDLEGAVVDGDGVTLRRPLAVDPLALISSLFAANRQLANDLGWLETRFEAAMARIEALEGQAA